MKHSKIILCGFLLFIFSFNSFTQGQGAIPSLTLNPSPESNGLGITGVSNPSNEPLSFYYNPANLGQFAQNYNLSIQSYPGYTKWLGADQLKYYSYGINLGYNFKNELNGLNFAVGFGLVHNKFNIGTDYYDSYDAYGLGASINYYVTLSMGLTYKNITSTIGQSLLEDQTKIFTTKANAIDYGALLTIPVMKLISPNYSFNLSATEKITPEFNYNIGYSRSNIGNEIYYVDLAQKDPIPLTARLGNSFNFGINYKNDDFYLNAIKFDFVFEAEDNLTSQNNNGQISYQGLLGDINVGRNLIQLKADNNVVVHKGYAISFLSTVTILKGSYYGKDFGNVMRSEGWVFSTNGIFQFLNAQLNNQALNFITNHLEIKYSTATILESIGFATELSGITVSFSNFHFD